MLPCKKTQKEANIQKKNLRNPLKVLMPLDGRKWDLTKNADGAWGRDLLKKFIVEAIYQKGPILGH